MKEHNVEVRRKMESFINPNTGIIETRPSICGGEEWLLNGILHRDDGPAIIDGFAGTKVWYQHGEIHREDGPALILSNGNEFWYLNDVQLSRENYYKELYKRGIIAYEEMFAELL